MTKIYLPKKDKITKKTLKELNNSKVATDNK